MFQEVLGAQNPHWKGQFYAHGIQRECFHTLLKFLKVNMVVSLMGVRHSGKSTILKQLINHLVQEEKIPSKNILFLNLEQPFFAPYAKDITYLQKAFDEYLTMCSPTGKIYCLLDEVQFFHDFPIFIKAHYEMKKVKFVITGSNSRLLSADLMTMLSGRTLPIDVFPLSFAEVASAHAIPIENPIKIVKERHRLTKLLDTYLQYGGFPEVAIHKHYEEAADILGAYTKTILYQDVVPRIHARQPYELERIFTLLLSHFGKSFSYNKLASLFDCSDKSLKDYIQAFSDAYLLFELDAFSYLRATQIRSPKKVYGIDMGQINAMTFTFSQNVGRLFENAVFLQLKRCHLELFYYKTKNNLEVDFIAKHGSRLALIQTAWHMHDRETKEREYRALEVAMQECKVRQAFIVTRDEEDDIQTEHGRIIIAPAYKVLCMRAEEMMTWLF